MIPSIVDTTPCVMSSALPSSSAGEEGSAEETLTDDWLACFDFGDIPSELSTQGDEPELPELDCMGNFDISCLLRAEENSPSFALSEEHPHFTDVFECFSSMFKADVAAGAEDQCVQTVVCSSPYNGDGSMVSSPYNSDAGSCAAVAECVDLYMEGHDNHLQGPQCYGDASNYLTAYSGASNGGKRQREAVGSDMEGGDDEEGKTQHGPVDKKQQRLQRNRELAFESRQRKKCYVSDLETKCKTLEHERNQLQRQICFSAAENAVLKEEIARLKKMKGRDGVAEPAVLFKDSLPLEFLSLLICLHLLVRFSLCVSPFLALVLQAVVCLQSPGEGEGLPKDSRRCIHSSMNHAPWSLVDHGFHRPFRICGLSDGWHAGPTVK